MEAKRDGNFVPTLIGVSSSDGLTPTTVYVNPVTHRILADLPGGTGTVTNVATGTGLTGGPIVGTGTISLDSKLAPADSLAGNSLKVLRVNAGETAVEYAVIGGSGTVTNTGTLTSNSIILGNGGVDTKVVAGITTNGTAQIVLGVNTTTLGTVKMFGNTSGDVTLQPTAAAGTATVQTIPTVTGTLVNRVTTGNGVSASNTDGALAFTLGAITPTTVNGNTITTGTGTLTIAAGKTLTANNSITIAGTDAKTLTVSNSITLAGTDATTMTFPTTSATIARTDAGQTFTGVQTMTSPALTTPAISGLATGSGVASAATASTLMTRDSNANASANNFFANATSTATSSGTITLTVASSQTQIWTGGTPGQIVTLPAVSTLPLGTQFYFINTAAATVTVQSSGLNSMVVMVAGTRAKFTSIATSGTGTSVWQVDDYGFNPVLSKVLTLNNSLTLAGTDNTVMTFPTANDTVAGLTATQTLTSKRITARIGTETSSATSTPTADTVDQWNVTALAVADTFAAPTGTPTDGQNLVIRIKDNGTARALSWNAIYRASSDLALPSTTILSKTLYLGFKYNAADSKWDLLALLNNF